jgi:thiol-disulfide isomerase/thioredoxin
MSFARVALLSTACVFVGCDGGSTVSPTPAPAQDPIAVQPPVVQPSGGQSPATQPPAAPSAAPAELGPVHRLTVRDLDGNPVSLAKFAGRPMIIEIWATWCGPCLANRRTVHSVRGSMPERMQVIGLSMDADTPASAGRASVKGADLVRNFLRSNPANDFEGMATQEFNEFIRTINPSNSIPKTLYVDSKGRVADLSEGTQSAKWLAAMAKNLK